MVGRKPPAWQTGAPDVTTNSCSLFHDAGRTIKVAAAGQPRHTTVLTFLVSPLVVQDSLKTCTQPGTSTTSP